jgi:hypothetical protein
VRNRGRTGLIAAVAGVFFGLAASVLVYSWLSALRIDFTVNPPRLVTGMHPAERDVASGLTFAWTTADVAIRLPALDRRVPWTMEVRVRGGQRQAADNPALTFFVDGIRATEYQTRTDFSIATLSIPARSDGGRGVLVNLQSSRTFVPGPGDRRQLGVMVDSVTLQPQGLALPPGDAVLAVVASGAAFGAAVAMAGVLPMGAVGTAATVAMAAAAVVMRGFGPFSAYPDAAMRLALAIAGALVCGILAIDAVRRTPLTGAARGAIVVTGVALLVKLLVQLHPNMPLGDALFQAHRFQEVMRGNLYFTSVAPGNYLFPYPPGLYVVALPFADLVRREMGDVVLLRVVTAVMDAIAALSLYPIVARWWNDRAIAIGAVVLFHLLPLDFLVAAGGTLTSAFAQSVAVLAFATICAPSLQLNRPAGITVATFVMLTAFLSHTSTFAMLSVTALIVAAVWLLQRDASLRSAAWALALSVTIAATTAVVVYYAHFMDVYRAEFARIGGETAVAAPDAGGRSIADRIRIVPYYVTIYYGIPSLVLAAAGAVFLRRARDRLTLALTGWAVTCALFLLLGVVTPVDMRYYVAAIPVVAIAAARGAAQWWEAKGPLRIIAAVLLLISGWIGVASWLTVLR